MLRKRKRTPRSTKIFRLINKAKSASSQEKRQQYILRALSKLWPWEKKKRKYIFDQQNLMNTENPLTH